VGRALGTFVTPLAFVRELTWLYCNQIGENVGLIQGRTLLLGNKLDLIPEKRDAQLHVTKEEAETFVKSYSGVTYHEVSAKDGKWLLILI
jgi:hypothetical protein